MVIMIFTQDHGNYPDTTAFGLIFWDHHDRIMKIIPKKPRKGKKY